MSDIKTKEQLVQELAALNSEDLKAMATDLKIEFADNIGDDTLSERIIGNQFPEKKVKKVKAPKKAKDSKYKKVLIEKSPSGRFFLSYSVGEVVPKMEAKQADELIKAGYALEVQE
jgi:hypothetical protein